MKKLTLFLIPVLLIISSCKKDEPSQPSLSGTNPGNIDTTVTPRTIADISGTPFSTYHILFIDKNNNIWSDANGSGLNRFDRSKWIKYNAANSSLPEIQGAYTIRTIKEDGNGILWIGSKGGLTKFDRTNWTTYNASNGLLWDDISAIAIDADNHIWASDYTKGITKFDGTTWTTYTIPGMDGVHDKISNIVFDKNGVLWVSKSNGLASFDGIGWTDHSNIPCYLLYVDSKNNIWSNKGNNLVKYDRTTWQTYTYQEIKILPAGSLSCVVEDDHEVMWVSARRYYIPHYGAYSGGGYAEFNKNQWTAYPNSSEYMDDIFWNIAIDKNGDKWLGWYSNNTSGLRKISD